MQIGIHERKLFYYVIVGHYVFVEKLCGWHFMLFSRCCASVFVRSIWWYTDTQPFSAKVEWLLNYWTFKQLKNVNLENNIFFNPSIHSKDSSTFQSCFVIYYTAFYRETNNYRSAGSKHIYVFSCHSKNEDVHKSTGYTYIVKCNKWVNPIWYYILSQYPRLLNSIALDQRLYVWLPHSFQFIHCTIPRIVILLFPFMRSWISLFMSFFSFFHVVWADTQVDKKATNK